VVQLFSSLYEYLVAFAKIAPAVVAVVALFALAIAFRQSKEASRARNLTATKLLLDEIGNDEVRAARIFVLETMPSLSAQDIRQKNVESVADAIEHARRVGVAYDRIGMMVKLGLVDERTLYDSQRIEIRAIWKKIEPIVSHVRTDHHRENYFHHFDYLANNWLAKMDR
jgi:hypothetical protein